MEERIDLYDIVSTEEFIDYLTYEINHEVVQQVYEVNYEMEKEETKTISQRR